MKVSSALSLITLITLSSTLGLDDKTVRDRKCPPNTVVDPTLDWDWIYSVKDWYVPLWNKLELYRTASDILGKPLKDLNEDDIAYPCIVMDNTYSGVGFGRKDKMHYDVVKDDDEVLNFKAKTFNGTKSGRSFSVLTDNKSFVFGITCWEDGEAGWAVMASTKTLEPFVKKVVMNYIKDRGFNPAMAVESGYELCDGNKGSFIYAKEKKNEL